MDDTAVVCPGPVGVVAEPLMFEGFGAARSINYALHPNFSLPMMTSYEIDEELARFEYDWESKCNVNLIRRSWGWSGGRLFKFISRNIILTGGYTALGLAYLDRDEIHIHNGTRNGGRHDYWINNRGVLAVDCDHELGHWIWSSGGVDGMGHSGNRSCVMHSDLWTREFCPTEVSRLRQLYGAPERIPSPPPPFAKGTWDFKGMAPFEFKAEGLRVIPLFGRWNGNPGIGLYDPATAMWYLRLVPGAGPADLSFQYGPPNSNYQPIVGDWNGDGKDGIGLYVQQNGVWLLRDTLSAGVAEHTIQYGPGGGIALNGGGIGTFKNT